MELLKFRNILQNPWLSTLAPQQETLQLWYVGLYKPRTG